jgi:ATP-dependent DNA helicase RecQ
MMMTSDILDTLGLTDDDVIRLDSRNRSRLLSFLLRWNHLETLHRCLDLLIPRHPHLVSLLDLRARALQAEEAHPQAEQVMRERLDIRSSMTARIRLARLYLAQGKIRDADAIARELVESSGEQLTPWYLALDVALAEGDMARAAEACRRLRELRPYGRAYLRAMRKFMQARRDWVTASSYAAQLLQTANVEQPLSVGDLQALKAYFEASGERTRVVEMEDALQERRGRELDALSEHLGTGTAPERPMPRPVEHRQASAPEDSFREVRVSSEEARTIQEAVQRHFGFPSLRPGQKETLACVLRGEDVLTILPTGGGKSLCYQLPAMLAENGVTLVVSPLIALMKDQLDSLPTALQRRATTINSSLDGDELRDRLRRIAHDQYRLVYAAPERLRQPIFLHALQRAGIRRLVVDEAHCVSFWGHDFRPDYLKLGEARRMLGDPPVLGLTATAPPRVRRDIVQHLSPDREMRVIAGDVTRPNLQLEVLRAANLDEKLSRLLAFCQAEQGSGIIYAGTRARCEQLTALLRRHGIQSTYYHAGIPNRDAVQDDFMSGRTRIVVATIAFGLGIDKPDIRFIVHFVPANSLEAYYQEAGRAGRDGQPARCLLMLTPSDRGTLTRRLHRDQMDVTFLRALYGAVSRRLGDHRIGRIAPGDLERDVRSDDVHVRVGLSILEETDLIRQGPDIPRACMIRLQGPVNPDRTPDLATFSAKARLRPRQWLNVDLVNVAQQTGIEADVIEGRVLEWAADGHLNYRFSGRDILLEQLDPPSDASARISLWLERYETIQAQRIDEIAKYAKTRHCRHGHLNTYLGGRTIDGCGACDNCIRVDPPESPDLPDETTQLLTILRCAEAAPWSWGRVSLLNILRGSNRAPQKGRRNPHFGSLAFRSQAALQSMIAQLEACGAFSARKLDNGGVVLDLTGQGCEILRDPSLMQDRLEGQGAKV